MSDLKEVLPAELARQKLSELRRALSGPSDPPVVENLLPALPEDNIAKLQTVRQGKDCKVNFGHVHIPDGSRPGDIDIFLTKDGVEVSDWIPLPNPVPADFSMTLSALHTATPGPFKLGFTLQYGSSTTLSPTSLFYIDTVAPNHGAPGVAARAPAGIVDNVISKEYLEAEGEVVMDIETPDDVKQGDIVRGYYGYGTPSVGIGVFEFTDDLTEPIKISISKDVIERSGEGSRVFYFRYYDRVGNVGDPSDETKFTVQLTPIPSRLQPPEVPAAADGLVDREDATPVVAVLIPTFDYGLTGDHVRVFWAGRPQVLIPTDGTSQVIVDVPYADVENGGNGPKDALVSYVIVRNGVDYPETTGTTVRVDLTIAGPGFPNPDPEEGNPNLLAPTVQGADTTEPNKLQAGDIGQAATVTAPIYIGAKLGDEVRLYWNGVPVPDSDGLYEPDGTEVPGTDVMSFRIASSIFEATNNGFFKVHYVITNPANGSNENPSLRQEVDVYIYPVTLPNPVIQHLFTSPTGRISLACSSLREIAVIGKAAIVRVSGSLHFAADMELNFTWSGIQYAAPGNPDIPVDAYPIRKKLQGNEHVDGFEVYLPFNAALKPIADGLGSIIYTAEINGHTETSLPHDVRVIVKDTNENYCPGT